MKIKTSLLVLALLTVGAGTATDAKKEFAKIAGKWDISEITYNGKDHSELKLSIHFKDDVGTIEGNARVKNEYARIKFKLDPTTTPKIMDLTIAGGSQQDATMEAIYELKGDEMRICAKVFGKDRPAAFAAAEGSSTVLLVLKRSAP